MPLYPGSFRGVPFETEESDVTVPSPRGVVHWFPGVNLPTVEQLGAAGERFTETIHVVGDDYQDRAKALREAFAEPGPGKLVHWQRGTITVKIDPDNPPRERYSTGELRLARFQVTFIRTGPTAAGPTVAPAHPEKVAARSAAVRLAAVDGTEANFSTSGPNFLETSALTKLSALTTKINRTQQRIQATFSTADLAYKIDDFSNAVATLIRTPRTLALETTGLLNSIVNGMTAITTELRLSGSRGDAVEDFERQRVAMGVLAQLGNYGDDFDPVAETTPSRAQEAANDRALRDMVQAAVLADVLEASAGIPLESIDQADDILDQVELRFDALLTNAVDDGLVAALRDLRADFFRHLQAQTAELSALSTYTPPVTTPLVLIAHRVYGDANRDSEILRRNPSVRHPGFVTGQVPVEILVDG